MRKSVSAYFGFCLLLFIILFSCSPLKKYKSSVGDWEADIRKFEHLDSTETYPKDAVLFMGSSSIRLWNTLQTDMQPYQSIQRGFGGSRISDLAWYTPRIVYPHACKAIVIYVGNDIIGSEKDKTPQEVATLFKYIVKTIRKKLPETPVFYIQVTPTESRWKVWPTIQQGNELVKQQCGSLHKTYYIGAAGSFVNSDGLPDSGLFRDDKLHLNTEGYKLWTKIIRQNLDSILSPAKVN